MNAASLPPVKRVPPEIATLLVKWREPVYLRWWQVTALCDLCATGPHKQRELFGKGSAARKFLRGGGNPVYDRAVVLEYLGLL